MEEAERKRLEEEKRKKEEEERRLRELAEQKMREEMVSHTEVQACTYATDFDVVWEALVFHKCATCQIYIPSIKLQ